jgi:hypothetical protein
MSHPGEAMSKERDFQLLVAHRLAGWPTSRILDFERWLLDEGHLEFLPAVRDALWERTVEHAQRARSGSRVTG